MVSKLSVESLEAFFAERLAPQGQNALQSKGESSHVLPFEFSVDDLKTLKTGSAADKACFQALTEDKTHEMARKRSLLRVLFRDLFPTPTKEALDVFISVLRELVYLDVIDFNSLLIQGRAGSKEAYQTLISDFQLLDSFLNVQERAGALNETSFIPLHQSITTFDGWRRYFHGKKGKGDGCEKLDELEFNPSRRLLDTIAEINFYRLYSIWALGNGGALDSLHTIPELLQWFPFIDWTRFDRRLSAPGGFLSGLSWQMYLTRFSFNVGLIFKHYFLPTEKEKVLDDRLRLMQEIGKRKYVMWNDSVWFIVNLLSATILLTAISPLLGSIGGLLNVGLMVSDFFMVVTEEKELHNRYLVAKRSLEKEIDALEKKKEANYQAMLVARQKELILLNDEWAAKEKSFSRVKTTTVIFTFSMALMYAPDFALCLAGFLSSSPMLSAFMVAAPWLMLVGGVLSLALTIVETTGVHHDASNQHQKKIKVFDEQLNALKATLGHIKGDELTGTLAKIALIEQEIIYHKQAFQDEKRKVMVKSILMTIAPIALFLALNIASTGLMLAAVVTLAVLTIVANYTLDKALTRAKTPNIKEDIHVAASTQQPSNAANPLGFFKSYRAKPLQKAEDNTVKIHMDITKKVA